MSRSSYLFGLLLSSLVLAGCPAEGPIEPSDDMGDGSDATTTPDMGEEATIELDGVEPASGPIEGGTEVTLTGSGFVEGMTVRFGSGASVDATVASETEATATTPASPMAGSVTVVVRTPDGETDSLLNGFEYTGDTTVPTEGIGFCQLQAQSPVSATTGVASDGIFAVVFAEGITNSEGQGGGIEAELGYGTGDDFTSFSFTTMSYNLDKDGLNPGDLANDEYGAPLTVTEAGTYRYVARFRTTDDDAWTYCDLDGSDGSEGAVTVDQLGTLEVTDPPTPTVGFCRTDTISVRAETGSASGTIRGTVFVAGATSGAGAGDQVVGEILYGPKGMLPASWTETATATYVSDADGLVAGDLANDVWEGTITVGNPGDYQYVFRFSADGGSTWLMCDTDGSTGENDFVDALAGELEVQDMLVELPDACNLQFPQIVSTAEVGVPLEVYGRVTEAGMTGNGMSNANLVAELVVGQVGIDPSIDLSVFETIPAMLNTNTIDLGPDEDEYVATFTPSTAGEYSFAYRFSVDGGTSWSYCGLVDEPNQTAAFDGEAMGWVNVSDGTPDLIDFCHVWQDTLTDDLSPMTVPTVTVEVFEDPVTVNNGGSNSAMLEAEAGVFLPTDNPAIATTGWTALPYKGLRPGVSNNYEYEGTIYPSGGHPAAGTYNVFVRVRKTGDSVWTYCDTDETADDLRLDAATRLTISP